MHRISLFLVSLVILAGVLMASTDHAIVTESYQSKPKLAGTNCVPELPEPGDQIFNLF